MTLPARLRAHDPAAIREVYTAIVASRGVLAEVGRLLSLRGNATAAAGRIVALAGLEEQLAAVQQEHGTGGSGRRPRRRWPMKFRIETGLSVGQILTPATRARCVDALGMATVSIEIDETGRVSGRLVKEG